MNEHKPCIGDYIMAQNYKAELIKLKKQLAIAVEALTEIEKSSKDVKAQSPVTQCVNNWLISHRTLIEIEELEK